MESKSRTDRLLHENVEAFESALEAGRADVVTPEWPDSYLGVLDGSNQDETTLELIHRMHQRHPGRVLLTTGAWRHGSSAEEGVLEQALQVLSAAGIQPEGVLSDREESHDRVLDVIAQRGPGLCLMPSPFSHDLGALAQTTLSTTVEVCLARTPIPVVLVRGVPGRDVLERPHLVVDDVTPAAARATRLALGSLRRDGESRGRLTISFVYGGAEDPDVDDAIAQGFACPPHDLIPLLSRGLSSFLHRLIELAAVATDLQLETRLIRPGDEVIDEEAERGRFHVLPLRQAHHGVPQLVHEFVLSTVDPVLCVPAPGRSSA